MSRERGQDHDLGSITGKRPTVLLPRSLHLAVNSTRRYELQLAPHRKRN